MFSRGSLYAYFWLLVSLTACQTKTFLASKLSIQLLWAIIRARWRRELGDVLQMKDDSLSKIVLFGHLFYAKQKQVVPEWGGKRT